MNYKNLIRLINEAIVEVSGDYDFLGFENYKKDDSEIELLKSKEFQNQMIDDIVFGSNQYKVVDETIKEFKTFENNLDIVLDILIKYYYDNQNIEFILIFEGYNLGLNFKSKQYINYNKVSTSILTKNGEIITKNIGKNIGDDEKMKLFNEKFLLPILRSQIKK